MCTSSAAGSNLAIYCDVYRVGWFILYELLVCTISICFYQAHFISQLAMDQGIKGSGWEGLPSEFRTDSDLRETLQVALERPAIYVDPLFDLGPSLLEQPALFDFGSSPPEQSAMDLDPLFDLGPSLLEQPAMNIDPNLLDYDPTLLDYEPSAGPFDSQPSVLSSKPAPQSVIFDELECDLIYEDDGDSGFVDAEYDQADESPQVQRYEGSSASASGSTYFDADQNRESYPLLDRDPEPVPGRRVPFKSGDRLPLHKDTPLAFFSFFSEVGS